MTRKQLVIETIRAAFNAITTNQTACLACGMMETEQRENAAIVILQYLLTKDEYSMLGILIRRLGSTKGDIYLPRYGEHCHWEGGDRDAGCISIDQVVKLLDTAVADRTVPEVNY